MASFDREALLYDPVAEYTRRKSYRWQVSELPFYEYRIDLFAFSRTLELTVAVELKLHRWQRAVEQSLLYQLCADLVFIALPKPIIERVDFKLLSEHGIGLIGVAESGRCRMVLDAMRSSVVRPHYRDHYIQVLQKAA